MPSRSTNRWHVPTWPLSQRARNIRGERILGRHGLARLLRNTRWTSVRKSNSTVAGTQLKRHDSSRPYVQVLSSIFTSVTLSIGTHVSAASAGFTSETGRPLNWTLWLTCPARFTVESPMRAYDAARTPPV
jgi:hypothetical protein